jgi:hypothetical protein
MQRIRTVVLLAAPLLLAFTWPSAAQETPWRWALDFGWHGGARPLALSSLAVSASGRVVHRRYWDVRVEASAAPVIVGGKRNPTVCIPLATGGAGDVNECDYREMAEFATSTLMVTAGPTGRNVYAVGGLGAYAGRWAEKDGGGKGPSSLLADVGFGGFVRTGMFDTDRVKLEGRLRFFVNTNRGTVPALLLTAGYAR